MLPPGTIRACSSTNHPGSSSHRGSACRDPPGQGAAREAASGGSGEQTQPTHPHHDSHNSIKNIRLSRRGFWGRGNSAQDTSTTMGPLYHCQHSPSQQQELAGRAVGALLGRDMQCPCPPAWLGMATAPCPWPPPWGALGVPAQRGKGSRNLSLLLPSIWGLWDSKTSAQSSPCTRNLQSIKFRRK